MKLLKYFRKLVIRIKQMIAMHRLNSCFKKLRQNQDLWNNELKDREILDQTLSDIVL